MMSSGNNSGGNVGPSSGDTMNAMSSLMGVYKSAKDKWDASGGNEAIGRVSASIPDSTKQMMSTMIKRENIRTISIFLGLGEERPYYVEKIPSLLIERIKHNLTFFYLNYAIMTCIIFLLFCLTLLISPTSIIVIGLLAGMWFYFIRASSSTGYYQVYSVQVPQKTIILGMGGITAFVIFYLLSGIFWWTLFSSSFFILAHALLRDASMHKDMGDVVQMEGDLHFHSTSDPSGESAFLKNNQV